LLSPERFSFPPTELHPFFFLKPAPQGRRASWPAPLPRRPSSAVLKLMCPYQINLPSRNLPPATDSVPDPPLPPSFCCPPSPFNIGPYLKVDPHPPAFSPLRSADPLHKGHGKAVGLLYIPSVGLPPFSPVHSSFLFRRPPPTHQFLRSPRSFWGQMIPLFEGPFVPFFLFVRGVGRLLGFFSAGNVVQGTRVFFFPSTFFFSFFFFPTPPQPPLEGTVSFLCPDPVTPPIKVAPRLHLSLSWLARSILPPFFPVHRSTTAMPSFVFPPSTTPKVGVFSLFPPEGTRKRWWLSPCRFPL